MKHYFVQHGKAVSKDIDKSRPLSDDGLIQTRTMAIHLANIKLHIKRICHSGKQRAAQTADIFADELGLSSTETLEGMSPNDSIQAFSTSQLTPDNADTMYVGHLPHLDKLASHLLCENETANCVTFQNSSVICIETDDDGSSSILWYKTPATL